MQRFRCHVVGFLAIFSLLPASSSALAATPEFTFATTNVTMTSSNASGSGSSTFTLTSMDGYSGTIQVVCVPPTHPTGVKIPYCNGPIADPSYALTANQTVTGKMTFNNAPIPDAATDPTHRQSPGQAPVLALAGMLLWGVAVRRRVARLFTFTLFAAVSLVCLAGISACGGSSSAVTPGTYVYTFSATDTHTSKVVTASLNVTVP